MLGSPFKSKGAKISPLPSPSVSPISVLDLAIAEANSIIIDQDCASPVSAHFAHSPSSPSPRAQLICPVVLFSDDNVALVGTLPSPLSVYKTYSDLSTNSAQRNSISLTHSYGQPSPSTLLSVLAAVHFSESSCEAATHLGHASDLLFKFDHFSRQPLYKQKFQEAIGGLQDTLPCSKYNEIIPLVSIISKCRFKITDFDHLPTIVVQEMFQWLTYDEFCSFACVSRLWRDMSYEDVVWKIFYVRA